MPTKHAKLSASASSRWLNCPGSVRLADELGINLVDNGSSAAQEGTTAHGVGERMLEKDEYSAQHYVGQLIDGGRVTQEMVEHVEGYTTYCREHMSEDAIVLIEERLDYSQYVPGGFGTADCLIYSTAKKHIDVIDLKYGAGVSVDAFENTQGQLYALGALNEMAFLGDIDTVTIHIYQPRKDNISTWTVTANELHQFGRYAQRQANLAINGEPLRNLNPTDKGCMWCAMKAHCPALQKFTEDTICADFDNIEELPKAVNVGKVVAAAPLIRKWLDAVEEEALAQAETGKKIDGCKLVYGRGSTSIPEDKLIEVLGDDAYTQKLVGVTAAKKILGAKRYKEELEPYAEKRQGKLKLVGRDKPGREVSVDIGFEEI